MAETTIQKEARYDGTRRSALEIIFGRTFGHTLVQVALVFICVIWSLPTIGLLVSSFRTPNDINSSGWWTSVGGSGQVSLNSDVDVLPADEEATERTEINIGEAITVSADDSRLLREAPSGFPAASIASFGVREVSTTVEVTAFGEPVSIPGAGTIVVSEDGTFEFTPDEGFDGFFNADVEVGEDAALPLAVSYTLEGREIADESLRIDLLPDDVDIDAYGEPVEIDDVGTVVVNADGSFDFEAAEGYSGEFELTLPEGEPPFEAEYAISPYGQSIVIPRTGSIVVSPDGTFEFEQRGNFQGTIDITIDPEDAAELPFRIDYVIERPGGRLATASGGETLTIPGFGDMVVEGNGAYEINPDESFVGSIEWLYNIQNPFVTLDNYDFVLTEDQMDTAFINSLTVSIPATIIPIAIAAFAAYAFAWMEFPGRRVLFVIVVGLMVVPLQVAFIPLLNVYTDLSLNGTFLGLWLAHTGFGMPLAVFLLRNYIAGLPRELIESASIDGASHFTIFLRLVLPLSIPALASFAIFQFLWVWNDLLVALVFLGDRPVVTSRLSEMVGSRGQDWFVLTSGAFITMIVPLVVFFSLQRYFVRGLLAGSVKGG